MQRGDFIKKLGSASYYRNKKAEGANVSDILERCRLMSTQNNASMKIMDVTIKGVKGSDEYKMAQAYNQGLRDAMSIFEREMKF